ILTMRAADLDWTDALRRFLWAGCIGALGACERSSVVAPATLPIASVRIYLTTGFVEPLQSVPVYVDARDAQNRPTGGSADAMWSSSNPSVAVIAHGIVTGVSPGDATITGYTGGLSASTVVHIGWRSDTRLFIGSPDVLPAGARISVVPTLFEATTRTTLAG